MTAPAKLAASGAILASHLRGRLPRGTQSAVLVAPPPAHSNELGGPSASVDGYILTAVEPDTGPGPSWWPVLT